MEKLQTKPNLGTLNNVELRRITGGCVGPFCIGYVLEAWQATKDYFSGYYSGLADGFVDSAKAGARK